MYAARKLLICFERGVCGRENVVPRFVPISLDFSGMAAELCAPASSRRQAFAIYFRKKTSGGRAYLQIVESRREGARSASR